MRRREHDDDLVSPPKGRFSDMCSLPCQQAVLFVLPFSQAVFLLRRRSGAIGHRREGQRDGGLEEQPPNPFRVTLSPS